MIRVEGFGGGLIQGFDQDAFTWSDDDGDVGDWQSLLSQSISTVGTIYNNRLAAKAGRQIIGLQGAASVQPLQPIPGATVFQDPAPPKTNWMPLIVGAVVIGAGFMLLRR